MGIRRLHQVLLCVYGLTCAVIAMAGTVNTGASERAEVQRLYGDVNAYWSGVSASMGGRYTPPGLSFFARDVQNVCHLQGDLTGSFYCPADQHVYIDEQTLHDERTRAGTAAELATAVLVAHEVAHHVQAMVGTTAVVENTRRAVSPDIYGHTLTTFELQADCYAGLWLRWAKLHHEVSDTSATVEALNALAAVSADHQNLLITSLTLVDPLNQGSDAQRLYWLNRGLETGRLADCDTFAAEAAGKL